MALSVVDFLIRRGVANRESKADKRGLLRAISAEAKLQAFAIAGEWRADRQKHSNRNAIVLPANADGDRCRTVAHHRRPDAGRHHQGLPRSVREVRQGIGRQWRQVAPSHARGSQLT